MKALLQRASRIRIYPQGCFDSVILESEKALLIFLGVGPEDTEDTVSKMIDKIVNLRIFPDEHGKTNLNGQEFRAGYVLVSQFTLYADCKKGKRPSFHLNAHKEHAESIYKMFASKLTHSTGSENVQLTPFGSDLSVELINDGPFTIPLDSKELGIN